ncbi:MAG: restriction endonuclease subunit S [Candidatus Xenobium sp.]|jgi:type I restriction enzyme S subunit
MADNGWVTLPFDQAVLVNPPVRLERGEVYPFVDMQAVDPGSRSVGPSELREFKGGGSRFMNGDTLMARITPCLENGKIARYAASKAEEVGHGSTEFIVIRGRPNVTDNGFAYYLTKWDGVRQYCISQMTGSSGRQRVPTSALSHREVTIPPLKEQEAIACILGTLDDKIELNRQMNRTLEEMARAIFKSWFVDFDPVRAKAAGQQPPGLKPEIAALFPDSFEDSELGEIPKGWSVESLDKTAHFLNGLALQKYPPTGEETLPVIKIAQLRSGNTTGADRCNIDLPVEYVVEDGDVLFSWSGSLECVLWSGGNGALNQHLFKVTSAQYPKWFYYLWINHHLPQFRHIAAGKATTMGHIQRHHLSDAKVIVPGQPLVSLTSDLLGSIIERVVHNNIQSRTLAALRDTLLPKLISGELRVPDAERIAGRCV